MSDNVVPFRKKEAAVTTATRQSEADQFYFDSELYKSVSEQHSVHPHFRDMRDRRTMPRAEHEAMLAVLSKKLAALRNMAANIRAQNDLLKAENKELRDIIEEFIVSKIG